MTSLINWFRLKYYQWKYRNEDPDVCCCGDYMRKYCSFGYGCRSMKEYAITSAMERK